MRVFARARVFVCVYIMPKGHAECLDFQQHASDQTACSLPHDKGQVIKFFFFLSPLTVLEEM